MKALFFLAFATIAAAQSPGDLILQFKGTNGASLQYVTPSTGTGIPAFNGASPNRLELLPRSTFSTPADVAAYAQPLNSNLTTLTEVTSGTAGRNVLAAGTTSAAQSAIGLGITGTLSVYRIGMTQQNIGEQIAGHLLFQDKTGLIQVRVGYNTPPTTSFDVGLPTAAGEWLTSGSSLNADNISSGSLALARIAQGGATSGQAMVWNGSAWAPGSVTAPVTSVAGRTGAITLSNSDISGLGTMATQAANGVAITGGSITGLSEFASSDPDFTVDTYGNATSRFWKIRNDIANSVTLELAVTSGAVPSTPSFFVGALRVSGGAVYISPSGGGTVIVGTTYLSNNLQSSLSSDGDRVLQLGGDSSTPGDAVFHGPDGSGTNITGGKTIIRGGNGTGTGGSGAWELQTSPVGSSGSTANTPRATLRGNKDGTIDSPTMPVETASDPASTHKLTIYINGVRYKLLAIQE